MLYHDSSYHYCEQKKHCHTQRIKRRLLIPSNLSVRKKLGVAQMERGLTYLVLAGNRRIAYPACERSNITVSELVEENIKLVGNRFGEMRRVQEVKT